MELMLKQEFQKFQMLTSDTICLLKFVLHASNSWFKAIATCIYTETDAGIDPLPL